MNLRISLQLHILSNVTSLDRSKVKAFIKSKDQLDDVALELSIHGNPQTQEMGAECQKKVDAMASILKSYKKFALLAEADMKKEQPNLHGGILDFDFKFNLIFQVLVI